MIARLALTNWRAYENLELELEEGTTFVVAANGVGKTSILMAAAWGLLGDASGIDAKAAIRGSAPETTVSVEVSLGDGRRLSVVRTARLRGRPSVEIDIDGKRIDDEEALGTLETVFGVEPRILARLAFMVHGGHLDAREELDLRDHLYRVFGVAELLDAAGAAELSAREAKRAREQLRRSERAHVRDIEAIQRELQAMEAEFEAFQIRHTSLESALEAADTRRRNAERWSDYETAVAERTARVEQALSRAREILPNWDDRADPLVQLHEAEERSQEDINEAHEALASARGRKSNAEEAVAKLRSSEAVCPTCLRPLSSSEAESALREHQTLLTEGEARLEELGGVTENARGRLESVREAIRELSAVPAPPTPPASEPVDPEDAAGAYTEALEALRSHDSAEAELRARHAQLAEQFRGDEEARAAEARLRLAYRREALIAAAADVLRRTADRITEERIDPLTNEVAWRWKRLFGSEGLILKPDGRIRRQIGERELEFTHLSGGEKIWALLVTRLLVVGASTSVPFVWLDEPLEHLDPKLRRIVAGSIARASGPGGVNQIVVTTYEHALARQLAEDTPGARLIAVRPGGAEA